MTTNFGLLKCFNIFTRYIHNHCAADLARVRTKDNKVSFNDMLLKHNDGT